MNRLVAWAYTACIHALVPLALMHLWWRGRRQPAYRCNVGERFGRYGGSAPGAGPSVWIHAVSVGETRAAQPLVKAIRARHPGLRIVMTHTTPTGRETGDQLFGDAVERIYLPYDLPFAVAAFLDRYRPVAGVLMETELWPNLLQAARRRGVPVALVNARLSERSARGYRRVARLTRMALECLAGVAAQTAADAERLVALGARGVTITGSMKFDIAPPDSAVALGRVLRERFGAARAVLVAASTREGEEALLIPALAGLPAGTLTVLVPRHPQRFDEVAGLLAGAGVPFERRSAETPVAPGTRVVLGDSMGELFAYYAAADVAFVGGSLLPLGGQNLIEACAMGTPVLVGPHTFNFQDITAEARRTGAAREVPDAAALVATVADLLAQPEERRRMGEAGRAFATAHRGATDRVMDMLEAIGLPGTRAPG
ncbi:MAG: lipid IV(A) 3-deoxy-D-manno-octulosonic acid transferase [Betaproteobacteria bacterium]